MVNIHLQFIGFISQPTQLGFSHLAVKTLVGPGVDGRKLWVLPSIVRFQIESFKTVLGNHHANGTFIGFVGKQATLQISWFISSFPIFKTAILGVYPHIQTSPCWMVSLHILATGSTETHYGSGSSCNLLVPIISGTSKAHKRFHVLVVYITYAHLYLGDPSLLKAPTNWVYSTF